MRGKKCLLFVLFCGIILDGLCDATRLLMI